MPGGLLWTHKRFLGYAWSNTALILITYSLVVMAQGWQELWNLSRLV